MSIETDLKQKTTSQQCDSLQETLKTVLFMTYSSDHNLPKFAHFKQLLNFIWNLNLNLNQKEL